jgi:hypothetical protein
MRGWQLTPPCLSLRSLICDNLRFEKPQMAGTHFQEGVDLNRLRTETY